MTVVTEHEQSQPLNAEELVRSIAEEPPISPEFRARVLAAASEATATSTRKKGWLIAAGFSALCTVCVLMVVVLNWNTTPTNRAGVAEDNPALRTSGEDIINRALDGEGDVISGGVGH